MNNKIEIRKIENGFIVIGSSGKEYFYANCDSLFKELLFLYEDRSENLGGPCYGRVEISRSAPNK